MNGNTYDVVIIGGGVIGSSIARALSKYECRTVLLEKEEDAISGETFYSLEPGKTNLFVHLSVTELPVSD